MNIRLLFITKICLFFLLFRFVEASFYVESFEKGFLDIQSWEEVPNYDLLEVTGSSKHFGDYGAENRTGGWDGIRNKHVIFNSMEFYIQIDVKGNWYGGNAWFSLHSEEEKSGIGFLYYPEGTTNAEFRIWFTENGNQHTLASKKPVLTYGQWLRHQAWRDAEGNIFVVVTDEAGNRDILIAKDTHVFCNLQFQFGVHGSCDVDNIILWSSELSFIKRKNVNIESFENGDVLFINDRILYCMPFYDGFDKGSFCVPLFIKKKLANRSNTYG